MLLTHAIGQVTEIRSIVETREEAVMRSGGQGGPVDYLILTGWRFCQQPEETAAE